MKALVVGLGSMGKRRIRNLKAIGIEAITGVDPREDRRDEASGKYGINTATRVEDCLSDDPDVVIISTPPDLHIPIALDVCSRGIPFFTEAGVPDARLPDLIAKIDERRVIAMPSCTMRYFSGPKAVTHAIRCNEFGKVLLWTYHSGQYLPDWHPWERIQDYYVANRETGGCREIVVFELAWLINAVGAVQSVIGTSAKVSQLPVDIDDVYQLTIAHTDGARGQLTVDVLARYPVRFFRAICENGTIEWHADRNVVRSFLSHTSEWHENTLDVGTPESGYVNPEEPYIDEMRDFLKAVRGQTPLVYDYREELAVQRVLTAAEQSGIGFSRV